MNVLSVSRHEQILIKQNKAQMNESQTCAYFKKWWTIVSATVDKCCFVSMHANVRILGKHWYEINRLVEPYILDKLDMIVFSETNIKSEEETLCVLDNFQVFPHNRGGRRGGGTMVFINQNRK